MPQFGRNEPSIEAFNTTVAGIMSERCMNGVRLCKDRLDNAGGASTHDLTYRDSPMHTQTA